MVMDSVLRMIEPGVDDGGSRRDSDMGTMEPSKPWHWFDRTQRGSLRGRRKKVDRLWAMSFGLSASFTRIRLVSVDASPPLYHGRRR